MRREASNRSAQRASCYSHMGKQNKIITREILVLAMWFIKQNDFFFFDVELVSVMNRPSPNRPEPARPSSTRPEPAGHDAL